MEINYPEDVMKFFRKGFKCKNICSFYKATETVNPQGYVNQYRCEICDVYLYPAGISGIKGHRSCKCCGKTLFYVEKIDVNSKVDHNEKLSTPTNLQNESGRKSYIELVEFIEQGMKMQANYQLVMLKFLVNHKIANKGQIAEDLAYWNNKNINDLDEIKKIFNVPVFLVLENKGFVKKNISVDGVTEFILNVDLGEFQTITISDLLDEKIKNYNLEHNIPENEFDISSTINWSEDKSIVRDIEIETAEPNLWIWSVTPENWEIVKSKHIWGSKIPKERIGLTVKSGDQVAFYVIGSNCFRGIFEFIGEWYDSPGETWSDDLEPDGSLRYKSQIKLKPIQLGSVNVPDLYEKMDLFIDKAQNIRNLILQGSGGYPSNNKRPLLQEDFEIIKQHLAENPTISESKIEDVDLLEEKTSESSEEKVIENNIIKPEQFLVFDSQEEGLAIKHYELQNTDVIKKEQILSNDELMEKFGVGNMGGIRYSRKNNILILCSTNSNDYADEIDEDANLIKYTGEGQIGEQVLTGGNYKIANSENIPMLFFKERYQEPGARKRGALDNIYSFVGKVRHIKYYWKDEPDRNGNQRRVVKFLLEVES